MSTLWFTADQERQLRADIRASLAPIIPAEHVDMVVDLSMQASRCAIETIERVCSSSPDPRHFSAAVAPTVGIVAARCAMIEGALKEFAAKQGFSHTESKVVLGGQD